MEKEQRARDGEKTLWTKASIAFFVAGLALAGLGYAIQRMTLFIYTGWPVEPAYAGRILAALGAILIALGLRTILKLKKFAFLLALVLVVGADIVADRHFVAVKTATLERELGAGSVTVRATIERVNTMIGRASNSMKRPYMVCSWEAGGTKVRQLFWIAQDARLAEGQSVDIVYSPRNPRIAKPAD